MPQFPRFYIANSQTEDVANKPELDIELSFDNDEPGQQKISITDFEFVVEANKNLLKLNNGLIGGGGVFEGIPFRVEVERNGTIERPFIGYLDLSKGAEFGVEGSTISAVDKAGIDFLNDVADGFTFEYLYSIGRITNSDFISVPYVLNSAPFFNKSIVYMPAWYLTGCISIVITSFSNFIKATKNKAK